MTYTPHHPSLTANGISARHYSAGHLEPGEKKDFDAYVSKWHKHFHHCQDNFELERGLNHIFAADWVPSVEVVSEALRAARRVNSFATAIRILEALEQKVDKPAQYQEYIKALGPLISELGVPEKKDLGAFDFVMEKRWKNM
jgi:cytochrome c oxidase subunit 5a